MAPFLYQSNGGFRKSKPVENGKKKALVTFLGGGGDYVKGVIGLAKRLRQVNSAYPLVVAVLPNVPQEHRLLLVQNGCILKDIDWVQPPKIDKLIGWAHEHFAINYSKLCIFQYKICYCQQCTERVQWPAEMGQPSQATYDDLINTIKITLPSSFAQQDWLNLYSRGIFKPISNAYNRLVPMLWTRPGDVELNKVKVVHFCSNGSKPWRYTGKDEHMDNEDVKMLVKKWGCIYDDDSLSCKKPLAANVGGKRVPPTGELNLVPKHLSDKKRGLRPMVTGRPVRGSDWFGWRVITEPNRNLRFSKISNRDQIVG